MILGLMGAAGSGKSTAAKYLADRYAATRFSFADPLKAMVARAFDLTHAQCWGTQAEKEAIDPRYNVSARWLLQRIGTEGCRAVFGQNFWIDQTLAMINRAGPGLGLAVIEDVRFCNEATAIRAAGGVVWRLECPDRQSSADAGHASEAEWLRAEFDRVIEARLSPGSVDLFAAIDRGITNDSRLTQVLRLGA